MIAPAVGRLRAPVRLGPVVITTYTFGGPNGVAVSQLRERYAVSLGTATRGAFYEPDPGVGDGWKLQRTFALTKIERP